MKKIILICSAVLLILGVAGCGKNTKTDSSNNTPKTFKKGNQLHNDTFTIGGQLTYKITSVKWVSNATNHTRKTLVLECDITNNGKKSVNLVVEGYPYKFITATQKNNGQTIDLQPGSSNVNSMSKRKNIMNQDVAAHKTVKGLLAFDTVNNDPVTVTFRNKNGKSIGVKTYNVE